MTLNEIRKVMNEFGLEEIYDDICDETYFIIRHPLFDKETEAGSFLVYRKEEIWLYDQLECDIGKWYLCGWDGDFDTSWNEQKEEYIKCLTEEKLRNKLSAVMEKVKQTAMEVKLDKMKEDFK